MQNRKTSTINALTTFLQNNELTYAEIGNKIKEKMEDPTLGIKDDPWLKYDPWDAEKRVSRLALGNKPTSNEKQALALWEFEDQNKWPYLYFPNNQTTYDFMQNIFSSEIKNVIDFEKNTPLVKKQIKICSKLTIRNGINAKRITPQQLAIKLLGLLYLHTTDEVRTGQRKRRRNLAKYAKEWFSDTITPDSPLVTETKIQLRQTLSLTNSRKKELKQVVLRQLISVL